MLVQKVLLISLIKSVFSEFVADTRDLLDVNNIFKRTPHFIKQLGFLGEIHDVTTEDGYILEIHRIPPFQLEDNAVRDSVDKPVVLIMHGLQSNSDNWFITGEKSLPIAVADEGYDVWLGNTRGNSYGQRHQYMNTSNPKFWEFSFHEQGYYDLAAIVDYVLEVTGREKLFLIAHSKGCTITYILLSLKPEYNKKFNLIINFAPVAYLDHASGPLIQLAFKLLDPIFLLKALQALRIYQTPKLSNSFRYLRTILCGHETALDQLCWAFQFLNGGFDYKSIDMRTSDLVFSHFPDTVSFRELLHYLQIGRYGKFDMFDHGEKNEDFYNSSRPPKYPLERITAPIFLFFSPNDFYVTKKDFNRLLSRLPNVVGVYTVPMDRFNHLDYVLAKDGNEYVYQPAIKIFKRWNLATK